MTMTGVKFKFSHTKDDIIFTFCLFQALPQSPLQKTRERIRKSIKKQNKISSGVDRASCKIFHKLDDIFDDRKPYAEFEYSTTV